MPEKTLKYSLPDKSENHCQCRRDMAGKTEAGKNEEKRRDADYYRKNKLVYSDVLVGDVWVASGQSNMEWGIKVRKEYADDIAHSEDSLLRLFFVPKNTSLQPLSEIEIPQGTASPERAARWVLCTPEMLAK